MVVGAARTDVNRRVRVHADLAGTRRVHLSNEVIRRNTVLDPVHQCVEQHIGRHAGAAAMRGIRKDVVAIEILRLGNATHLGE